MMSKYFAAIILLISCPLIAAESCGNFPPSPFDDRARRITGTYANPVYGYSVDIPRGEVAYGSRAPNPNHGIGIILSWNPRAYIYFDGSHAVFDDELERELSLDAIADYHLRVEKAGALSVLSTHVTDDHLGVLPAKRLVIEYTCPSVPGIFVTEHVVALGGGIVYSASLSSPKERYAKDRRVLAAMIKTWREVPRPPPNNALERTTGHHGSH